MRNNGVEWERLGSKLSGNHLTSWAGTHLSGTNTCILIYPLFPLQIFIITKALYPNQMGRVNDFMPFSVVKAISFIKLHILGHS